jgi:tetratricopeptide (TPR) repeat protein
MHEDIRELQRLLATHRQTLAILLKQHALHTSAYVPSSIVHGIDEAQENIRRIKQALRKAGVSVEDYSIDEDLITIRSSSSPKTDLSPLPIDQVSISNKNLSHARSLTRQARIDFDANNYVDAEMKLCMVVELDPDSPGAWGLFGRVLNQLGKYNEAVDALSRAIDLTSTNRSLYSFRRGIAYAMLGKYGRSLDDFNYRLKVSPNSFITLLWRAKVWLYLSQPRNSLTDINKCIDLKADSVAAHAIKAIALLHISEPEEANKEMEILNSLQPEGDGDFYHLALAYSQLKTVQAALDALRTAIALNSRYSARAMVEPLFLHLKDNPLFCKVIEIG